MHRIDTATAVDGRFVNKDPDHSIRATKLNAEWFNSVQEELMHLLESAGIDADDDDDTQVEAAIKALLSGSSVVVYSAVSAGVQHYVKISGNGLYFSHLHNGEEVLDSFFTRNALNVRSGQINAGDITSSGTLNANALNVNGQFSCNNIEISNILQALSASVGALSVSGNASFASGKTVSMNGQTNVANLNASGSLTGSLKGSFAHDTSSYWLLDSPTDLGQIDAGKPRRFVAGQRVCFCNTSSSAIVLMFKVMKGSITQISRSLEPGKFLDCVVIGQDGSDWVYSHADSLAD